MALLKPETEAQVEQVLTGLQAQVTALPEEGRLKLFSELIRQYCTRCGKKQPDKNFCKCGLT